MQHHKFEHSEQGVDNFLTWLKGLGFCKDDVAGICLESTGRHSLRWALILDERLGAVSIVNPAKPKSFGKSLGIRDKSDRVDACLCAMFGRMKHPAPTNFRSEKRQELCELFRCYHALDRQRIANEQRLNDGPSSKSVRKILRDTITNMVFQITALEQAMEKTIEEDEERAASIKGIGKKSVWVILGEFGDLHQYKRNELVALAGLFPKEFSSGTSVHKKACLAKGGGGRVRQVLYMAAMSAQQHNPQLKVFSERLKKNGKAPMQILCAVMRKLLLMVRAVVISGKDYDPKYLST